MLLKCGSHCLSPEQASGARGGSELLCSALAPAVGQDEGGLCWGGAGGEEHGIVCFSPRGQIYIQETDLSPQFLETSV